MGNPHIHLFARDVAGAFQASTECIGISELDASSFFENTRHCSISEKFQDFRGVSSGEGYGNDRKMVGACDRRMSMTRRSSAILILKNNFPVGSMDGFELTAAMAVDTRVPAGLTSLP
ncbi:MAG: hypothetical protein ACRERU_09240 [Methylococcales bacterium]